MFLPRQISGIYTPLWAFGTVPQGSPEFTMKRAIIHGNPALRNLGGMEEPDGQHVFPYQDTNVPLQERVNPVRIMPEQYSSRNYAYYNTAYNSRTQPSPRIVSQSGRFGTIPVNYESGMYSWVNPTIGRFRM